MQKPLMIAAIAVVAVIILIAIVLMIKPAQPPVQPPITPPQDSTQGKTCSSDAECKKAFGCCGNPIGCQKSPVDVRVQCPQGLMCAPARPELQLMWGYYYCECARNGSCEIKLDKAGGCAALCEFYKAPENQYQGYQSAFESMCAGEACDFAGAGGNVGGSGNVSARYDALIESCQQAAQNAEDWYASIEACMANSPLVAQYKNWCESLGGYFGQLGMMPIQRCNPAASDSGKTCLGNGECDGWCEAVLTTEQDEAARNGQTISGITGKCSQYRYVYGCRPVLENGTIQSYICID